MALEKRTIDGVERIVTISENVEVVERAHLEQRVVSLTDALAKAQLELDEYDALNV